MITARFLFESVQKNFTNEKREFKNLIKQKTKLDR